MACDEYCPHSGANQNARRGALLAARVPRSDRILLAIARVAFTALAATTLLGASRTIVLATAMLLWLGLLVDALVRHPPAPRLGRAGPGQRWLGGD